MTSEGKAPYIWTVYENAGDPLRKALGIEIETDQEGGSIEGTGDVEFAAELDGSGAIDSTGTGARNNARGFVLNCCACLSRSSVEKVPSSTTEMPCA